MISIRLVTWTCVALVLAGCGSGTVAVTSSAANLWATDTSTLTCTLTTPAGTPPAIAQSCQVDISPAAAGGAPSPIAVPAGAGAATTTFTAGPVTEDTTVTIKASWLQPWATDPTSTTTVTVHPPRATGAFGGISVIIEPSVARLPNGKLRYTYVVTTQSGTPLAPSDDLMRFSPTFQVPASLVGGSTSCSDMNGLAGGATSQPAVGPATTFVVKCNVASQKMTAVFDADASPGGTTNFTVIFVNASGAPSGSLGGTVTGPT